MIPAAEALLKVNRETIAQNTNWNGQIPAVGVTQESCQ